jgi:hypothetical protein
LPVLLHAAGSTVGWRRLLPTEAAGQSGTAFLIGCLPAALVLAFWKRRAVWLYVDAAAPSLLIALAVS